MRRLHCRIYRPKSFAALIETDERTGRVRLAKSPCDHERKRSVGVAALTNANLPRTTAYACEDDTIRPNADLAEPGPTLHRCRRTQRSRRRHLFRTSDQSEKRANWCDSMFHVGDLRGRDGEFRERVANTRNRNRQPSRCLILNQPHEPAPGRPDVLREWVGACS